MLQPTLSPARADRGFTLVEVLVGLVLGMIGIIIMYQVFQVFEAQRRTTVSGGNAQTSGHIAMFAIERQVRLAGLGTMYASQPDLDEYRGLGACPLGIRTYSATNGGLNWVRKDPADPLSPPIVPITPVVVDDGGAAGSDAFTVVFGPSAMAGAPAEATALIDPSSLAAGIPVKNAPFVDAAATPPVNAVFRPNDIVLIAQPTSDTGQSKHCVRLKVSRVELEPAVPGRARLFFDAGPSQDENPPVGDYGSFLPSGGYTTSPRTLVMHAGGAFSTVRYRLNGTELLQNGVPIADGVVSMQVQYGIGPRRGELGCLSTNLSEPECQVIKGWTSAVLYDGVDWGRIATDPWPTAEPERRQRLENVSRIKAVRIMLVLRSQNLEAEPLYGDDPISGNPRAIALNRYNRCDKPGDVVDLGGFKICALRDPAGGTAVPLIDLTGTPDWDRYRYRVYETVIPLRNVIWSSRGA